MIAGLRTSVVNCIFRPSLFRLFSTSDDLFLDKFEFSPAVASLVTSVLNRVKCPEKSHSILSFLKDTGFSDCQLEKIVKYRPAFLAGNLERTLKPKFRVFRDLGLSSEDITKIISMHPAILHLNMNTRVIPSFYMLKGFLGSTDAAAKLVKNMPRILCIDLSQSLFPNIEFLRSCSVPMERILRLLNHWPRSLCFKPETFIKFVEKAEEMGANRSSKMFIYAVHILSSNNAKTLELKFQSLQNCGFSEGDVKKMFVKAPQLFSGSAEKLVRTKNVLLATGKYDIACIVHCPQSLTCSITKRYKPRFHVLEFLERRNLIQTWPTLSTLSKMSDKKFCEKFVDPYLSEVGAVYFAETSVKADGECKGKALD